MIKHKRKEAKKEGTVTLKVVAAQVGLTAGTVSLVLNHAPQSSSIPQHTKDRIFAAARELNYQPNLLARALRTKHTPTLGPTTPEISNASGALMFVGAEHFRRAIDAIREAGLRVPGDVSVVGFNRAPSAGAHLTPGS